MHTSVTRWCDPPWVKHRHPGPRRRRPRTWEKSGSSATRCCAPASHGRTIGRSTYVRAFGHIVLASDAVALSRPNGKVHLGANNPCGNNVVEDGSTRGALLLNAVTRSS